MQGALGHQHSCGKCTHNPAPNQPHPETDRYVECIHTYNIGTRHRRHPKSEAFRESEGGLGIWGQSQGAASALFRLPRPIAIRVGPGLGSIRGGLHLRVFTRWRRCPSHLAMSGNKWEASKCPSRRPARSKSGANQPCGGTLCT